MKACEYLTCLTFLTSHIRVPEFESWLDSPFQLSTNELTGIQIKYLSPAFHMGDPVWVQGSWLHAGSISAVAGIWSVNQEMEGLAVCLCISLKFILYFENI